MCVIINDGISYNIYFNKATNNYNNIRGWFEKFVKFQKDGTAERWHYEVIFSQLLEELARIF